MITDVSVANSRNAAEIFEVAQAAYTIESAQIGCADFPPLRESIEDLRASSDRFLVFRQDDRIVGVLSFVSDAARVRITRLVVSPAHHRRGIASALLAELERRVPAAAVIKVSTARDNVPAVRLYERNGYAAASTSMTGEGIALVHFTSET